jgi:uncharacterized damage-inducible protein DinB
MYHFSAPAEYRGCRFGRTGCILRSNVRRLSKNGEAPVENLVDDFVHEFRRHQMLADQAMAELDDPTFFRRPAPHVNPVALIVKHLGGNLISRWTDFLTSDGEKPGRDRDSEFGLTEQDTRANLLAAWNRGWQALFDTLGRLSDSDLQRQVKIRGEAHSVQQALLRGLNHAAYHTGQILYLVRLLQPDSRWLTIAPGQSQAQRGAYREPK